MFNLGRKVLEAPIEAADVTAGAACEVTGDAAEVTAGAAATAATGAAVLATGAAAVTAGAAATVVTGAAVLAADAAAIIANTIEVDGFRIPKFFDPDVFRAARQYRPGQGRVVVVSYPKCGTTWMSQIVSLILRRGVPAATATEFFSMVQLLEVTPLTLLPGQAREGCLKTHLPYGQTAFSRDAKYIYVVRNPEDCVVAFFNHLVSFPLTLFEGAFESFFELFLEGGVEFGDFFDHLLSWYEQRNEPNVLYVSYESLRYDLRGTILRVAEFMGQEYHSMLLDDGEMVLRNVLQYSAFDYMVQTVGKFYEDFFYNPPSGHLESQFPFLRGIAQGIQAIFGGRMTYGGIQRKGKVDIVLTDEQRRRLEIRIREKCTDPKVMFLWTKPRTIDAGGVRTPRLFDLNVFNEACRYRPGAGRVVVASYPKSGTTWVSQLVSLILRNGRPHASAEDYFRHVQLLEVTPVSSLQGLPREGCLKTHLPFEKLTYSNDAKYIYVLRNPEDSVVAFYNYLKSFPGAFFAGTFDDFFELFLRGDVEFGDYFGHVLSWYERRNEPNVLFVTYESLLADLRGVVMQLARFMGDEYFNLIKGGGEQVLQKVLQFGSLEFMAQTVEKFYEVIFGGLPSGPLEAELPFLSNFALGLQVAWKEGYTATRSYKRGKTSRITLSERQRQLLDARTRERFGSSYAEWSTTVTSYNSCSSTTVICSSKQTGGQETDVQYTTTTTTTKRVVYVQEK